MRAIAGAFERQAGPRAKPVSRGLYPHSHFYDAHGAFHLLNTCNTRVARMLRAGGLDISPAGIVTGADMMVRLRAVVGSVQAAGAQIGFRDRLVY